MASKWDMKVLHLSMLCHTNPCPNLAFKHVIFHDGTRLANVVEVKSIMGGILTQIGNVENNDFNSNIIYIKSKHP
jgi:hypothetical protein